MAEDGQRAARPAPGPQQELPPPPRLVQYGVAPGRQANSREVSGGGVAAQFPLRTDQRHETERRQQLAHSIQLLQQKAARQQRQARLGTARPVSAPVAQGTTPRAARLIAYRTLTSGYTSPARATASAGGPKTSPGQTPAGPGRPPAVTIGNPMTAAVLKASNVRTSLRSSALPAGGGIRTAGRPPVGIPGTAPSNPPAALVKNGTNGSDRSAGAGSSQKEGQAGLAASEEGDGSSVVGVTPAKRASPRVSGGIQPAAKRARPDSSSSDNAAPTPAVCTVPRSASVDLSAGPATVASPVSAAAAVGSSDTAASSVPVMDTTTASVAASETDTVTAASSSGPAEEANSAAVAATVSMVDTAADSASDPAAETGAAAAVDAPVPVTDKTAAATSAPVTGEVSALADDGASGAKDATVTATADAASVGLALHSSAAVAVTSDPATSTAVADIPADSTAAAGAAALSVPAVSPSAAPEAVTAAAPTVSSTSPPIAHPTDPSTDPLTDPSAAPDAVLLLAATAAALAAATNPNAAPAATDAAYAASSSPYPSNAPARPPTTASAAATAIPTTFTFTIVSDTSSAADVSVAATSSDTAPTGAAPASSTTPTSTASTVPTAAVAATSAATAAPATASPTHKGKKAWLSRLATAEEPADCSASYGSDSDSRSANHPPAPPEKGISPAEEKMEVCLPEPPAETAETATGAAETRAGTGSLSEETGGLPAEGTVAGQPAPPSGRAEIQAASAEMLVRTSNSPTEKVASSVGEIEVNLSAPLAGTSETPIGTGSSPTEKDVSLAAVVEINPPAPPAEADKAPDRTDGSPAAEMKVGPLETEAETVKSALPTEMMDASSPASPNEASEKPAGMGEQEPKEKGVVPAEEMEVCPPKKMKFSASSPPHETVETPAETPAGTNSSPAKKDVSLAEEMEVVPPTPDAVTGETPPEADSSPEKKDVSPPEEMEVSQPSPPSERPQTITETTETSVGTDRLAAGKGASPAEENIEVSPPVLQAGTAESQARTDCSTTDKGTSRAEQVMDVSPTAPPAETAEKLAGRSTLLADKDASPVEGMDTPLPAETGSLPAEMETTPQAETEGSSPTETEGSPASGETKPNGDETPTEAEEQDAPESSSSGEGDSAANDADESNGVLAPRAAAAATKAAAAVKKSRGRPPKKRPGTNPADGAPKRPSVMALKKSKESFAQSNFCCQMVVKLPRCRECRAIPMQRHSKPTGIYCRFTAFRKLRYTRTNTLSVSGFCDPYSDAVGESDRLWRANLNSTPTMDPEIAKFLLAHVGNQFCDLVCEEEAARRYHMNEDKTVAWKRVVQGCREMCDVCETTLFNVHWVCSRCGFAVCVDCYRSRRDGTVKNWGEPKADRDEFQWLLCGAKPHQQDKLVLTQIVAGDALETLNRQVHEARQKAGLPLSCECEVTKRLQKEAGEAAGKTAAPVDCAVKTEAGLGAVGVKTEGESQKPANATLSFLADVALSKIASDDSDSDDSDDSDAGGGSFALRRLLVPGSQADKPKPVKKERPDRPKRSGWSMEDSLDEVLDKVSARCSAVTPASHTASGPAALQHFVRRCASKRGFRERLPIRIMTLGESTRLYPNVRHSWLCDGKLLRLHESDAPDSVRLFRDQWKRGQPVICSSIGGNLNHSLWSVEAFIRDFGDVRNDLINCRTGNIVPNQLMRRFWEGFESVNRRLRDDKGQPMILKLKDWPPGEDFADMMPARFSDLMSVLPMTDYTRRDGRLNLASGLPDIFVRPDLGPKMYIAYGCALHPSKASTNLHLDVSDAVNIMVHVGIPPDGDADNAEALRAIDEAGCDQLTKRRVKDELPGALWHIYHAADADKIRDLLNKVAIERGDQLEPHHDPIHDQSWYLDGPLRRRLYEEYRVEGYPIVQCAGDAVFIPAGAPHQVRNLHSCIKVAEDFVSPENIGHCFDLTQEFRSLSDTHTNHEDKLQIKNIIYHAMKDAVSCLLGAARPAGASGTDAAGGGKTADPGTENSAEGGASGVSAPVKVKSEPGV